MNKRRRLTLEDVARLAGVSASTASRALNGSDRINEDTIARVRSAADRLGYTPHIGARVLRTRRTMTIGLVLQDLVTPVQVATLNGLTAEADRLGYTTLVTTLAYGKDQLRRLVAQFVGRNVDAIVIQSPWGVGRDLAACIDDGIPVIALWSRERDCAHIPVVLQSAGGAAADAARNIRALGHHRAAIINIGVGREGALVAELTSALADEGIQCLYEEVDRDEERDPQVTRIFHRLRALPEPPTILFFPMRYARTLMREIHGLGMEVPRDISLCSLTNSPQFEFLGPHLAGFEIEGQEVGAETVRLAVGWIEGHEPPNITPVTVGRWETGDTIGPAPGQEAQGSSALSFAAEEES